MLRRNDLDALEVALGDLAEPVSKEGRARTEAMPVASDHTPAKQRDAWMLVSPTPSTARNNNASVVLDDEIALALTIEERLEVRALARVKKGWPVRVEDRETRVMIGTGESTNAMLVHRVPDYLVRVRILNLMQVIAVLSASLSA